MNWFDRLFLPFIIVMSFVTGILLNGNLITRDCGLFGEFSWFGRDFKCEVKK